MKVNLFKIAAIMLMLAGGFGSCGDKNEVDHPKSDEQISINLSKSGSYDAALLIGKWDCIKFAYTADGIKISDVSAINGATLEIPVVATPVEHDTENRWKLDCVNSTWFICSISGNLIDLMQRGSTYVGIPPDHEENHITNALTNAYGFVIKEDELIIYFTGVKDQNLLILKKR
jgi:hypothetical protein